MGLLRRYFGQTSNLRRSWKLASPSHGGRHTARRPSLLVPSFRPTPPRAEEAGSFLGTGIVRSPPSGATTSDATRCDAMRST